MCEKMRDDTSLKIWVRMEWSAENEAEWSEWSLMKLAQMGFENGFQQKQLKWIFWMTFQKNEGRRGKGLIRLMNKLCTEMRLHKTPWILQ